MPRMSPEALEELLQQSYVGVVASLRADGRPYTVPLWWLWKDDAFWLTGTYSRVWCKQLISDGRASLCVDATSPGPGHFEVDGTAEALELPDFDIWPITREMVDKYKGSDGSSPEEVDAFFANVQTEPRLLFKLTPEIWRAIDMTVYRGKRADREFQAQAQ